MAVECTDTGYPAVPRPSVSYGLPSPFKPRAGQVKRSSQPHGRMNPSPQRAGQMKA